MPFILSALNLKFYASEPMAHLFFNHVGFMAPGASEGIVGAYLNPSVLAFMKNDLESYLGYSSSAKTPPVGFNLTLPVRMDSLSYTFNLSSKVVFSEVGGPDYVGVAKRLGPVVVGASVFRPAVFGASLDGDVPLEYESDSLMTFRYTVGDSDGDSVAVDITPYGTLRGTLYPKANFHISEFPMFVGTALGNRMVALGFGLNFRRVEGRLELDARVSVDSGTSLNAKVKPADPGWDAHNLNVSLIYDSDPRLLGTSATGSFAATYVAPTVGLNLNFLLVGLNVAAEFGMSGSTGANFGMSMVVPYSVETEVLSNSVDVDTATRTVSGDLSLRVRRTEDTTISRDFSATYRLARYVGLRGGVKLLFLSVSGAVEFPVDFGEGLFYYGRNYITPNLVLPLGPLEGRVGGVFIWRYAFFGNTVLPSAPLFYAGGGVSLRSRIGTPAFGIDRLDLGVRSGFLSYLVKVVAEGMSGGKFRDFKTTPTAALSLGVRFYVR